MEIDKQFQKLSQTRASFENAVKKDVESIVNLLKIQFDIYERGTQTIVSKDKLMRNILNMFEFTQEMRFCCGVTKTGTRCTKRSMTGSDYCKAHLYKQYISQQASLYKEQSKLYVMTESNESPKDIETIDGVEKVMIDGSFYWADSCFVYDMDTFDRVGYVEDGRRVLTDDPFELQ